jgi:hypothetical protein
MMRALADAVAYAHGQGVVHRDLKPSNVLLDRQGRPRVADFGLARRQQEGEGLTHTGQVLGTPNYMAPEQALGEASGVAAAVDVWGLGGLLYFLLTGKPPFSGPTAVSVLRRVVDEAPTPPHEINAAAPPGLQAICLKCLEKDPARRYASAAALGEALAEWEARQGAAGARKAPPGRARRWAGIAAALAVCGAGVLFAFGLRGWLHSTGSPTPTTSPAQSPPDDLIDRPELPQNMRHDFGLKVELIGGHPDANGMRVFREGDPVRFRIEAERDAYVGIWSIGPDGTVVQVFPNKWDTDDRVRKGQPKAVPEGSIMDAVATPPRKGELLRVVAATRPWGPLKGPVAGGFVVLPPAEKERFERHLRGILVRPKPTPGQPADDAVAEEALVYRVLPR